MAGIYLHIPFCNSKCIYCGFYSVAESPCNINRYGNYRSQFIPALGREISGRRDFFSAPSGSGESFSEEKIKTLYIGGGTPSVMELSVLERAVAELRRTFGFADGSFSRDVPPDIFEFTVEVNPDDVTHGFAEGLAWLGVNRVSMGIQSFDDRHLKWMGRRHDSACAVRAVATLRDAGFRNISLDLIFGFESLTEKGWAENLERIAGLNPEHISAYQMMIDEGTPLERAEAEGRYIQPDDSLCALQYAMLQDFMKKSGYRQYEVSNFAAERMEGGRMLSLHSRHNSAYWDRTPYLGLGPGAHSFSGRRREWNIPDLALYCGTPQEGIREGETLSDRDLFNETVMLGLRRTCGLSTEGLDSGMAARIMPVVESMERSGLLIVERSPLSAAVTGIKIPPEKLFVSDGIIRDLFV